VSAAVINMFRSIEGAKFDWQTCKWLFPLSAHDNLNVSFVQNVPCWKDILLLYMRMLKVNCVLYNFPRWVCGHYGTQ
jgi:hypothetical protein